MQRLGGRLDCTADKAMCASVCNCRCTADVVTSSRRFDLPQSGREYAKTSWARALQWLLKIARHYVNVNKSVHVPFASASEIITPTDLRGGRGGEEEWRKRFHDPTVASLQKNCVDYIFERKEDEINIFLFCLDQIKCHVAVKFWLSS